MCCKHKVDRYIGKKDMDQKLKKLVKKFTHYAKTLIFNYKSSMIFLANGTFFEWGQTPYLFVVEQKPK